MHGANNNDYIGIVSSAGDINGDGYDDVIIGATNASPNGKTTAGESYIIFGKSGDFTNIDLSNLTEDKGFKILGANSGDRLGYPVSSAGDVNGDGYDDIFIGALCASPQGRTNAGEFYIVFGKSADFTNIDLSNLTEEQGFKILGASSESYCGGEINNAGDINGDGYDDIIIGSYYADPNGRTNAGISYVIFGKSGGFVDIDLLNLATDQGFKILGSALNDFSGIALDTAGDVNGDGYDDIIIGAFGNQNAIGITYIIFGKPNGFTDLDLLNLTADQGFKILGSRIGDFSGWLVSAAGDVNGDGYGDIIVGSPFTAPNSSLNGGITYYIILGKSNNIDISLNNLTADQGFKILGSPKSGNVGKAGSVSSAGDVNGDGYADIIIGSYVSDPNNRVDAGISYIIFGKANNFIDIDLLILTETQGLEILGATNGDWSGFSVSSAGDYNGDGYDDIIIGAPYTNPNNRALAGSSYIIFGASNFVHSIPTKLPTVTPSAVTTVQPSIFSTLLPSVEPTTVNTDIPTVSPTHLTTSAPSAVPTSMPTQNIQITTGGTYNGTSSSENFIIISSTDVTISGGGGTDTYTVEPNANVLITVTDFNRNEDKINLQKFDIYSFNEVNITAGSIIINLEDNQKMRLLELTPGDIDANNFIFSEITPTPTSTPTEQITDESTAQLSQGAMVGIIIGGIAAIVSLSLVCAKLFHVWPFTSAPIGILSENKYPAVELHDFGAKGLGLAGDLEADL